MFFYTQVLSSIWNIPINTCKKWLKQNNVMVMTRSHVLGDCNSMITYMLYCK